MALGEAKVTEQQPATAEREQVVRRRVKSYGSIKQSCLELSARGFRVVVSGDGRGTWFITATRPMPDGADWITRLQSWWWGRP